MIWINGSVGKGGNNEHDDVVIIQGMLNQELPRPYGPIPVTGECCELTIKVIEAYQRQNLLKDRPSGRIEPNDTTFARLCLLHYLPAASGGNHLTEADFENAAKQLGCEVAAVKAVSEVESSGGGFFPSGRPKILFEAHKFSEWTDHMYDECAPDISSKKRNPKLYQGGDSEYNRLEKAMALNREAALKSASWGRFQVLGENCFSLGYNSIESFVRSMFQSEGQHLAAFIRYIRANNLSKALIDRDWVTFARGYNGKHYADNNYDGQMRDAYNKYSGAK